MLQHLLNSLTAKTIKPVAWPRPAQVREIVRDEPAPALPAMAQPKVCTAPRSVCTSLKDLCEL